MYIDEVNKKYHLEKLEGIIICEAATKGLKEAVAKAHGISLKEYKFSIDFGLTL